MALTFNFHINNKPNKLNRYVIYIRITEDRTHHKHIKTSIELSRLSDWNSKKQEVRQSEPDFAVMNNILAHEMEIAKENYRKLKKEGAASANNVKLAVEISEKSDSFIAFAERRNKEILDSGRDRSWQKFNDFLNKLKVYQTDKHGKLQDLLFSDITPAYLSKFEVYLHTLHNQRNPQKLIHPNTIAEVFKQFRTLINYAIKVEKLMPMDKDPFLVFRAKKVKTEKERLNEDEVNKIIDLDLEEGSLIWHVRNYWLFSFYCAGIRVSDVITMRWTNIKSDGRLVYQMSKNHKIIDIKMVPQVLLILDYYLQFKKHNTDYIFPLLDSNADYAKLTITQVDIDVLSVEMKRAWHKRIESKTALLNKYLKKIASLAGIEKSLTNHISRHSFAKVAKQRGVDNAVLKGLFAHSNLKITENYMGNFDTEEGDNALVNVFAAKVDEVEELLERINALPYDKRKELIKSLIE